MKKQRIDPDGLGCALVIFAFFAGIALCLWASK